MLPSKRIFLLRPKLVNQLISVVAYSRKSDFRNKGPYKIVKSDDVVDDVIDNRFGSVPNWELLAPKGYRFLLPGSIGPAWHEAGSMVPVDNFQRSPTKQVKIDLEALECVAQECPILLRQGVIELFPNNEIYASQNLTIVSLMQKNDLTKLETDEPDSEYDAKTFVWAAQEICIKLKSTGYWADFINPFSGRPYLSPYYKSTLYETDERFRCIGFEIMKNGNCKVIQSRNDKPFIGSLFTNAPVNIEFLNESMNED